MTRITAYKDIGFLVTLTQIGNDDSGVLEVVSEGKLLGYITVLKIEQILKGSCNIPDYEISTRDLEKMAFGC